MKMSTKDECQDPQKAESQTFRGLFEQFSQTTTIHGVSRLCDSGSKVYFVYWLIIIVIATGGSAYFASLAIREFLGRPYSTNIELVTRYDLEFPAVTVCNMNPLRRSMLSGTRFQDLVEVIDGELPDEDYRWFFEERDDTYESDASSEYHDFPIGATGGYSQYESSDKAELTEDSSASKPARRKREANDNLREPKTGSTEKNWGMDATERRQRYLRERREASDHEDTEPPFDDDSVEIAWARDWGEAVGENDWEAVYNLSRLDDFSDLAALLQPTQEELQRYGHQGKNFILQCTFDRKTCNYKDFKQFQSKHYGNCYVFNHDQTDTKHTDNSGAQFGLHLTLFLEQPEYVGILTPESGVRVSINDPRQRPFPEDNGITVAPGLATSIGMKQVRIYRLSDPYGDCTKSKTIVLPMDQMEELTEYQYSSQECRKRCMQAELFKKCQCVTDMILSIANASYCSITDQNQAKCRDRVADQEGTSNCSKICRTACNEITFTTSTSSSRWPTTRYEKHMAKRLREANRGRPLRLLDDEGSLRNNFVRLRVYYEELNYQEISQKPLYSFGSILGTVGGVIGLYIGASLFSLVEVLVFIISLVRLGFKRMVKVHPSKA